MSMTKGKLKKKKVSHSKEPGTQCGDEPGCQADVDSSPISSDQSQAGYFM